MRAIHPGIGFVPEARYEYSPAIDRWVNRRRFSRVAEGRTIVFQSSLRDFALTAFLSPALKRWAKLKRPSGTN
jgi:hypothetical protein